MLESVLVANRGEIARRIIRTARGLGVRTVAVYSQADAGAPHVAEADEAVLIGPPPVRESYLRADAILEAARRTGAAPETRKRLDALGAEVKIGTPEELGRMLAAERAKWTEVVKRADLKLQ